MMSIPCVIYIHGSFEVDVSSKVKIRILLVLHASEIARSEVWCKVLPMMSVGKLVVL